MSDKHYDPRIIIALDYSEKDEALSLVDRLSPELCRLKVGKELFTAAGPTLIEQLQHKGFDVFLDLKFHDIPNTVASACRAAAKLGVWMLNVHALGGVNMMRAAREALDKESEPPLLIAVTILTSMNEDSIRQIGLTGSPMSNVINLANLAYENDLDGVVCSAHEVKQLSEKQKNKFLYVTPGIRMVDDNVQDQQRIMTPDKAISQGADFLVIGRPVTQADDPIARLQEINNLIKTA